MCIENYKNYSRPKRIYIIGSCGSGKTTLSLKISEKINIKSYHLDDIFYKGMGKRPETEVYELLYEIIKKQDWIAEELGRKCFEKALHEADCIIFLHPHISIRIKRIIIRHIKQNIGLEKCSYNPNFDMLRRMLIGLQHFEKSLILGKDGFYKRFSSFKEKIIVLKTNSEISKYLDSL